VSIASWSAVSISSTARHHRQGEIVGGPVHENPSTPRPWKRSDPDRGKPNPPTVETQNFSRSQLSDDPPIVTTREENRRNYFRLDSQRADVILDAWPGEPDRGNDDPVRGNER
jgi:hypothetical protein